MSVQAGSDPFNSALLRAKEIAAKLQAPNKDNGTQDFDTRKRSFNGEEPSSKRPMMDGSGGGFMNQNSNIQGALKDEIRVPGSVVQYLDSETIQRLQAQTGCHIQLPPSGPDPNAERAITLSGNRQCIEHCKEQITGIIHQHAPEAHIGGMPGAGAQGMGDMAPVETVDMLIPSTKVGLVIGRGGETIKDLAVQSGCKMNMVQDGIYANAPEKPLRMHGTPYQIQRARELVSGIIQQEFNNRGPQGGGVPQQFNNGPFESSNQVPVPKEYVGIIIGRGGDTIKRLQADIGAKIQFNTIDPNAPGDRFLVVQGTKDQCSQVEQRIKEMLSKVQNKDTRFGGGPGTQQATIDVPANKCGLVIGKKGETINRMKEMTGAHIEMNKNSPHDAPMKQFFIKGNPDQIKAAQQEINKIIGDQGGYGGGYGGMQGGPHMGGMGGHNPMMQQAPAGGDPAAMAYQQQMAQYYAYYQQQQQQAAYQQQAAMQQPTPPAQAAAPAQPTPAAAAPATSASSTSNVQQQWANYYQQLVQMYGVEQAQVYWQQLSQQQNAQPQ